MIPWEQISLLQPSDSQRVCLASVNKQELWQNHRQPAALPSHDARTHALAAWLFKVRLKHPFMLKYLCIEMNATSTHTHTRFGIMIGCRSAADLCPVFTLETYDIEMGSRGVCVCVKAVYACSVKIGDLHLRAHPLIHRRRPLRGAEQHAMCMLTIHRFNV